MTSIPLHHIHLESQLLPETQMSLTLTPKSLLGSITQESGSAPITTRHMVHGS